MKNFLSLIVILVSVNAFAGKPSVQPLKPNQEYVQGELVSVESMCPENNCLVGGTILTFKFTHPSSCYIMEELTAANVSDTSVEITAIRTTLQTFDICASVIVEEERSISLVNVFPPFDVTFTSFGDVISAKSAVPTSLISGELVSVGSICQQGEECKRDGTRLTLKYSLPNPCYGVDVTYTYNDKFSAGEVDTTPVVLATAKLLPPEGAFACIAVIAEVEKTVDLYEIYPPFKLQFDGDKANGLLIVDLSTWGPSF